MKYKTIGAFKNVQNVPYLKAETDLKVGMGVILDRVNGTCGVPADADEAKACQYMVTNIDDHPERHSFRESVVVLQGEYVRADDQMTVVGMEIELFDDEISGDYDDLAVGDNLVFGTTGKLEVAEDVSGYKVYYEIIKKTAYMTNGILAVIHAGEPAAPADDEE